MVIRRSSSFILLGLVTRLIRIDARRGFNARGYMMETNEEIESAFRKLIDDHEIVVFSKTTCPFCKKVKQLFQDLNKEIHAFEVNTYTPEKCSQMQDVLQKMSGMRTVPNVYIRKFHVGGCSDTQQALADGTLMDMVDGTYKKYDFDYIVIGGGSGGLASAKEAASYNRKVAVCDFVVPSPQGTTWGLGGTCVNVGCIPKKLMHKASILGEDIQDSPHFGWTTDNRDKNDLSRPTPTEDGKHESLESGRETNDNQLTGNGEARVPVIKGPKHTWGDMVENIQNYIRSLNWKYRKNLKDKKVTYFNYYARFEDEHTLQLLDRKGDVVQTITGQNFLLAMGCRPVYPEFPGARDLCISSDDIFSMTEAPGKTLIVGASYISLETAGFLAGLGFDVTIMVRSILLRGFDQEIANMIGASLESHGVKFVRNCVPESVSRLNERELKVIGKITTDGTTYEDTFKTVFLAIGREPCTKEIGLDTINVELQKDGRVIVNNYSQTNIRNVFAVGDIIEEKYQLTPVAIQAGKLLAQRLYGKKSTLFNYMHIPTTVFTPLEYGSVGYSEELALSKFGEENVEVYHIHFQPLEWELSGRNKNKAFAKLVCLKNENERVVGFHYLGPNAGEVTQGFALALKLGATKEDFNNLIGIHPTCAEIFTTMTITKSSGKSPEAGGC